jgi:hypothetical protein
MCSALGDVPFAPESGHVQCNSLCPLCANSGSEHNKNALAADNRLPILEPSSSEGTMMTHPSSQAVATIPADDPKRDFTLVRSDSANLPHIGLVGDTYTILVAGKDTAGRYCLRAVARGG